MALRVASVLVGFVLVVLPAPGSAVAGVAVWSVALVTWRWTVAMRRGIDVQWTAPARVQPDTTVVGVVIVRNRSRWPVPWLEVALRLPARAADPHAFDFVTRLGGRRERRMEVRFVAGDRGVHAPSQLTWRASDPLGMAEPSGTGVWRGATVIVPRLAPVRRLELPARSPLAELARPRSLFADETAIVGVRDYEQGDPIASIHWQATARVGRLMRTEHERAAARELLVCLDLDNESYQRRGRPAAAEAAIGTAASLLADTIIATRQQAGLELSQPGQGDAAPDVAGWPVRGGDRHLHTLLDALARTRLHEAVPIDVVVRRAIAGLHAGTSLVIVTGIVADDLDAGVIAAGRRGLTTIVVSVGSGAEWSARLPAHVGGAPCVPVVAERALQRLPL